MHFALGFLCYQLLDTIRIFISHWYKGGFVFTLHHVSDLIGFFDRNFALKITLRNFFKPLYQDYSFIGRILGIFFRSVRVIIAVMLYSVIVLLGVLLFATWAAIPIFLLFSIAFTSHL